MTAIFGIRAEADLSQLEREAASAATTLITKMRDVDREADALAKKAASGGGGGNLGGEVRELQVATSAALREFAGAGASARTLLPLARQFRAAFAELAGALQAPLASTQEVRQLALARPPVVYARNMAQQRRAFPEEYRRDPFPGAISVSSTPYQESPEDRAARVRAEDRAKRQERARNAAAAKVRTPKEDLSEEALAAKLGMTLEDYRKLTAPVHRQAEQRQGTGTKTPKAEDLATQRAAEQAEQRSRLAAAANSELQRESQRIADEMDKVLGRTRGEGDHPGRPGDSYTAEVQQLQRDGEMALRRAERDGVEGANALRRARDEYFKEQIAAIRAAGGRVQPLSAKALREDIDQRTIVRTGDEQRRLDQAWKDNVRRKLEENEAKKRSQAEADARREGQEVTQLQPRLSPAAEANQRQREEAERKRQEESERRAEPLRAFNAANQRVQDISNERKAAYQREMAALQEIQQRNGVNERWRLTEADFTMGRPGDDQDAVMERRRKWLPETERLRQELRAAQIERDRLQAALNKPEPSRFKEDEQEGGIRPYSPQEKERAENRRRKKEAEEERRLAEVAPEVLENVAASKQPESDVAAARRAQRDAEKVAEKLKERVQLLEQGNDLLNRQGAALADQLRAAQTGAGGAGAPPPPVPPVPSTPGPDDDDEKRRVYNEALKELHRLATENEAIDEREKAARRKFTTAYEALAREVDQQRRRYGGGGPGDPPPPPGGGRPPDGPEDRPGYIDLLAQEKYLKESINRRRDIAYEGMVTPEDNEEQALRGHLADVRRMAVQLETEALRSNQDFIDAQAMLTTVKRQNVLAERAALRAARRPFEAAEAADEVAEARDRANRRALRAGLLAEDTPENRLSAQQEAFGSAAEKERAASIRRMAEEQLAASDNYVRDLAATAAAEQLRKDRVRAAALGIDLDDETDAASRSAQLALHEKARADREAAALANRRLVVESGAIEAMAQRAVAERNLRQAIHAREREIMGLSGEGGNRGFFSMLRGQGMAQGEQGSVFQRMQAYIASRQGGSPRAPTEFLNFRQFFASRALTTAGFALSGASLYGALHTIQQMITEAEALRNELAILQSQFDGMGEDGVAGFERLRESILSTAAATGVSADRVALVTRQLTGVFRAQRLQGGDLVDGGPDVRRVAEETRTAFEFGRVTGLPDQEITDSLTAMSISFKGLPFDEVADNIIALENRFGVLSSQLVQFTADIAPLAAELGFTSEQISTLGAIAQQTSGKTGGALAENVGRVLTSLQEKSLEVQEVFARNPVLQPFLNELSQAYQQGNIPEVLRQISLGFRELSAAQANELAAQIAGRREAQSFVALLRSPLTPQALGEGGLGLEDGGLATRMQREQETVQFAVDRMMRSLEALGTALYDAGLEDALRGMADAGRLVLEVIGGVVDVFSFANDLTGGWAGQLLMLTGIVAGLAKTYTTLATAIAAATATGSGSQLMQFINNYRGVSAARSAAGSTSSVPLWFDAVMGGPSFQRGRRARFDPQAGGMLEGSRAQFWRRGAVGTTGASWFERFGGGYSPLATNAMFQRAATSTPLAPLAASRFAPLTGLAGVSGLTLGVGGIAALLGGMALQDRMRAGDARSAELEREFEDYDTSQLTKIADGRKGFWDRVRSKWYEEPRADIAQRILRRRQAEGPLGELEALRTLDLDEMGVQQQTGDPGFWTSIGQGTRGALSKVYSLLGDTSAEGEKRSDELWAAYQEGRLGIDELETALADGIEGAVEIYDLMKEGFSSEQRSKLDEAIDLLNEAAGIGPMATSAERLDDIRNAYARGDVGFIDWINGLESEIAFLKSIHLAGEADKERIDQIAELAAQRRRDISEAARNGAQYRLNVLDATGQGTPERAVEIQGDLLMDPGLQPEDRAQVAVDLYNAYGDLLQEEIDGAKTASAKAAIARRGIRIPEAEANAARQAVMEQQLRTSLAWGRYADSLVGLIETTTESFSSAVIQIMILTGATFMEAAVIFINGEIARVGNEIAEVERVLENASGLVERVLLERLEALRKQYEGLIGEREGMAGMDWGAFGLEDPGSTVTGDPGGSDEKDDDPYAVEKAILERRRAAAAGDPVELALIEQDAARLMERQARDEEDDAMLIESEAAMINANRQETEARLQVANARRSVLRARYAHSPWAQAQLDLQEADDMARIAEEGSIAEQEALAARLAAENTIADLMLRQFEAEKNLAGALATRAGNIVAAAQTQLDIANNNLADYQRRAMADGEIDPSERTQLDELMRAQSDAQMNVFDSMVQDRVDLIDYQHQMGEISAQQAAAGLQAIIDSAAVLDLNEREVRDLRLRIRALLEESKSDYMWNLPENIDLPTLYTARRLDQTPAGQTMTDNRTITINFTVNDGADVGTLQSIVADALGGPVRTGIRPRSF